MSATNAAVVSAANQALNAARDRVNLLSDARLPLAWEECLCFRCVDAIAKNRGNTKCVMPNSSGQYSLFALAVLTLLTNRRSSLSTLRREQQSLRLLPTSLQPPPSPSARIRRSSARSFRLNDARPFASNILLEFGCEYLFRFKISQQIFIKDEDGDEHCASCRHNILEDSR